MAGKGGYQKPANPAAVSGVGANSRRTDGHPVQALRALPDAGYGENKAFMNEQRMAPLGMGPQATQAPSGPPPSAGPPGGPDMTQIAPNLTDPSTRPDEPVTHGADLGPGADSSVLNIPPSDLQAQQSAASYLQQAAAQSSDPMLTYLAASIQQRY